ncbi:MAG: response regulator transcription factor [Bacteroidales bacterium]|jgi:two-component system LytT family response regulator|nr:response regulator transcription factor [Bacteroidales bacterium]
MKQVHAIIVDDERPARKELMFLLKAFPEIEVIGESDNINGAVDLIQNRKPDVVFLDIQLAGENGFELLEKVSDDFKLIFVTAYDEYAIRAFEVNATDYLLKPVDPERLEISIKRITGKPVNSQPKRKSFEYSDLIYVKLSNNFSRFIKLNSVIAFISLGNYTKILAGDGKTYIVLKTLKQWEEELPQKHFLRIHRCSVINLEYIQKIEKYSRSCHRVHMLNLHDPIEVSRSCASKLKSIHEIK